MKIVDLKYFSNRTTCVGNPVEYQESSLLTSAITENVTCLLPPILFAT